MDPVKRGRLVAFYSPYPRAGKTTACNAILESVKQARVLPFAGPLKNMLYSLLIEATGNVDKTTRMLYGDLKDETIPGLGVSPRFLMQTLGTEWGRETVSKSFWIDVARSRIMSHLKVGLTVLIDDMRFPNEYHLIKELGGECWLIKRPGNATTTSHPSEGGLDGYSFDRVLNNNFAEERLFKLHVASKF